MILRNLQIGAAFASGAVLGFLAPWGRVTRLEGTVRAQVRHAVEVTHIYSGDDGFSHAEKLDVSGSGNVVKLSPVSRAELHWATPSTGGAFHPERQRQYVITLSGSGEIEVAGGQKVTLVPGQIELVEDLTGKGHISRATGTEDRVALWLPLVDQTTPAARPMAATGAGSGR
jgi:hypothetical protein